MYLKQSALDWAVLNSGLFGSILGVVGAVALSTWITLYSLRRSERSARTGAFEEAMLGSAEALTGALVRLRYRLDPLFVDNYEHHVELSPEHVVEWMQVAYAHTDALAVEHRDYTAAAEQLTDELRLFTAAVRSAAGRDAETREDAYGWRYQRSDTYDSLLQAADWALAKWADDILRSLGELRRGRPPQIRRPSDLSLTARDGTPLRTPADFQRACWFPLSHLTLDAEELADEGALA